MDMQHGRWLKAVRDGEASPTLPRDDSLITDLTAALRVQGGAIQKHLDLVARGHRRHLGATDEQRRHRQGDAREAAELRAGLAVVGEADRQLVRRAAVGCRRIDRQSGSGRRSQLLGDRRRRLRVAIPAAAGALAQPFRPSQLEELEREKKGHNLIFTMLEEIGEAVVRISPARSLAIAMPQFQGELELPNSTREERRRKRDALGELSFGLYQYSFAAKAAAWASSRDAMPHPRGRNHKSKRSGR